MSVENKAEIRRKIISSIGLELWEVENFFFDPLKVNNVQGKINLFADSFPSESKTLLNWITSGLGPGEILLYFLCDTICLSGFKSQIDASINGKAYAEIKALMPANTNVYYDFRFGVDASEPGRQFLVDTVNFVNHTKNPLLLDNELEITRSKIAELRGISTAFDEYSLNLKVNNGEIFVGDKKICNRSDINFASEIQKALDNLSTKTPNFFSEIENTYFSRLLSSNIGKTDFLLFDKKLAKCIFFGKLTRNMLSIERVTQGKVKSFINLSNLI